MEKKPSRMTVEKLVELLSIRYKFMDVDELDKTSVDTVFRSLENLGIYVCIKTTKGFMHKSDDDYKNSKFYRYIDIIGTVENTTKINFESSALLKTIRKKDSPMILRSEISKNCCDGKTIYEDNTAKASKVDCDDDSLMDQWKQRMKDIKEIEKALQIDFKGSTYDTAIAKHIIFYCLGDIQFDKISEEEKNILVKASRGAHQHCVKNEEFTDCYCYDRNGSYASTLTSFDFNIPVGGARRKHIDKYIKCLGPALYKVKLSRNIDSRVFEPKKSMWYTDDEMEQIRRFGIEHTFCDGENFMEYDKYISSEFIFSTVMKKLFALKQDGNAFIKCVMTRIWGVISQNDEQTYTFAELEDMPMGQYERLAKHIVEHDLFGQFVKVNEKGEFKYDFGRMKPFIVATSRVSVTDKIQKLIKDGYKIYRCHTDSFITNMKPEETDGYFALNNEYGNYKVEKHFTGTYRYKNVNVFEKLIDNVWVEKSKNPKMAHYEK